MQQRSTGRRPTKVSRETLEGQLNNCFDLLIRDSEKIEDIDQFCKVMTSAMGLLRIKAEALGTVVDEYD